MKLDKKKTIVNDLHEKFLKSKIVIVTDYKGLNVATLNELRRKLREVGVEYHVVKNTLIIRASEETHVALIKDRMKGPNAVALGYEDPVVPAKALIQFVKQFNMPEITVGVMGDRVLDLGSVRALAALPSREVLLSQLLSAFNGVPTALVRALSDVPRRLLNVFEAIKEQKGLANNE